MNIVLDLFTVVVLNMGIAGAAIATVISQAVSAALVTRSLMKSYDLLKLRLRAIRIHPDLLRAEFRIGLPGGLQSCAYSISNIIIQAAINNFGTDTAAAWAAFGKNGRHFLDHQRILRHYYCHLCRPELRSPQV